MKKFLLLIAMIASGIAVLAQSPTIVTPAATCTVFRNFNASDEGFSSPSIYSSAEDVSFFWNAGAGAEIENSGLTVRNGSLISPVYIQSINGSVMVGFSYFAPLGTEFRIRVISGASSPPLEILANTANGPVYTPLAGTSGNVCLLLTDADLIIGREIRFEFTFRMNQPGIVLFDNLSLTVSGGPLPVTFQGFVARKNADETITLLWDVGTEANVRGYYIESSTNGTSFTNAGYIPASGKKIYSFNYPGKLLQTTFFRVRNVDVDGSGKYTPVIKVYAREQTNDRIQIYPVPANDQVTIQHNKSSEKARITLVDPAGKILQQVIVAANTLQTQLHIHTLSPGVYFVRYDGGDGTVQSARLIKN